MGASTRKAVEVQVNPEFGEAEALSVAEKYSRAIGRLPAFLLTDVDTISIHRGLKPFGGGNRQYIIMKELQSYHDGRIP